MKPCAARKISRNSGDFSYLNITNARDGCILSRRLHQGRRTKMSVACYMHKCANGEKGEWTIP